MLTIQAGKAQDTNYENYENSAAEYARFSPPSGYKLTVGMVADGIRGGKLGPESAIAGAMQFLKISAEPDIPALLYGAFETAHRIVRRVGRDHGVQLATTLTIALIVNDERLYVANQGHSRVYLYRAARQSFEQMTLEHNYANVAIMEGNLSPAEALKHPDAKALNRYIGTPKFINPDLTIYADSEVSTLDEGRMRGAVGLELEPYDTVLISTDGLTKPGSAGGSVLTLNDIVPPLTREGARQAARSIVEAAYRNHPSDSVSVVVLQAIPEAMPKYGITRGVIAGVIGIVLLFTVLVALAVFGIEKVEAELELTRDPARETAIVQAIIDSFTSTPTPTNTALPTATLPPDAKRVGFNFLNEPLANDIPLDVEEVVNLTSGGEYRVLTIRDFFSNINRDAYVFVQPATDLRFARVFNEEAYMSLDRHGDVFVAVRDYNMFEVELSRIPGIEIRGDQDSCFAIYYSTANEVTMSCYAGLCAYQLPDLNAQGDNNTATPTPIPTIIEEGMQIQISLDTVSVINQQQIEIPESEALRYDSIYQRREDLNIERCVQEFLPPPTATPTATPIVIPTDTPTATTVPVRPTARPTRNPYP